MRLCDFRALSFDCYGTLIDWERGILAILRPWAAREGVAASDEELLDAFARAETLCQRESPRRLYPDILRAVHARIAERWGKASRAQDADALANSIGDWPAFPDTAASLAQLERWHRLVVVSNVDRASFARTQEQLGVKFDAVVTAEEVGAYKPDAAMFRRALEVVAGWGIARREVLHVAQSLYHDHAPAKALGLATVWVHRRRGKAGWGATPAPASAAQPDWEVGDLAELAALEAHERGNR